MIKNFVVDNAAEIERGAISGIMGLLLLWKQQSAVIIFKALDLLVKAITGVSGEGAANSIGDVLFNRVGLTSANFFPGVIHNGEQSDIITNIGTYYNLMRSLSIALSLFVLVYVGIRMLISTVADEQAKYKKMLVDWATSLALLFVLHYIIIIVFVVNDALISALASAEPSRNDQVWVDLWAGALNPYEGWPELIVAGAFVTANLAFVLIYIKRVIILAFLIVISPLITVTYAIDRIGDGRSQALNTWLREFISTVLIQPFHCIIYITFYGTIMSSVSNTDDLGKMIFAASSALFMLKAENIVKKIFGIQPSSMGDALGAGAMALTAATSMFKKGGNSGKSGGSSGSAGKMPKMENNESKPSAIKNAGEKISNAMDSNKITKGIKNSGARFIRNGIESGLTGGAAIAGAIAGGTVGDAKTAASMSTAFGGVAKGVQEDIEVKRNEKRLERNQRIFAGAYQDFETEYKKQFSASHGGAMPTQQEIRAAAKSVFESDGNNLKDFERDLYDQMKQLSRSAKIGGQDEGFDFIENTIMMAQAGAIEPTSDYKRKTY